MRMLSVAAGWTWAAAIVWLSLTPAPPQSGVAFGDKLGHLAAYGLLMFWFARLYRTRLWYAVGLVAMGVALEGLQGALGYRSYEVADMAANTAGVLLGWGASLVVLRPRA